MRPLIFTMPWSAAFGAQLARDWGEVGALNLHRFPDGESLVRLDTAVEQREVVIVSSLHQPDTKIAPLLFAAQTARELGAKSVGLVAPYLAYMRQDHRFHAGEGVTAAQFARLVSPHFNWLVTVDPHLHRYRALAEIYSIPTMAVASAPAIAAWIRRELKQPLLVGPDEESAQWVATVARMAQAPHMVLIKQRLGDREVKIQIPEVGRWKDHTPVLVDDIISSGRTMAETIGHLLRQGLQPPVCIGTHAVFAEGALTSLSQAGAARVVTANTIAHASNEIDVTPLVVEAVRFLMMDSPENQAH